MNFNSVIKILQGNFYDFLSRLIIVTEFLFLFYKISKCFTLKFLIILALTLKILHFIMFEFDAIELHCINY